MGSALTSGLITPPAPNAEASDNVLMAGGPQTAQPGQQSPQQGQQPPQAPPAPDHAQTVAALRHFAAIGKQLELAFKDPELGKADIKDKVIDGMTTLVADRILSPAQAVGQLSSFPEKPFDQKTWLTTHMQQIAQARNLLLQHHAAGFAGQPAEPTPPADNHMGTMAGMMQAHYGNKAA